MSRLRPNEASLKKVSGLRPSIKRFVEILHARALKENDNNPMDGDATESLAKYFLKQLDELNANK